MNRRPKITTFAKILWLLGVIRLYKNGDTYSPVFRVWHPGTWLVFLGVMPFAAIGDGHLLEELPTRKSPYAKNEDFVNPFKV